MNEDDQPPSARPVRPKLSMTPSWVMLGFVLGAFFVLALPSRDEKPDEPAPAPAPAPPPSAPPEVLPPQPLTTIEAVFAVWGDYAVWDDDITEVVLWNPAKPDSGDFYEVRRFDGTVYFRSIPRLTRRIINRGKPLPAECPLQFTETEESYREWMEFGRKERRSETRPIPPRLPSPAPPVETVPPAMPPVAPYRVGGDAPAAP